MTTALITGVSGFVGQTIRDYLTSNKITVFGFDARALAQNHIFKGDITNHQNLLNVLEESKPDIIFHLAGILKSEEMENFYNVHVLGTSALLEAVMEMGLQPRVMVFSSSAVYGTGMGPKPITETFQAKPVSHYAASKLAQETVALRYFNAFDLPVLCVRTFNLVGPNLSSQLAPSAFARQIAQAERIGKPAQVFTGDLSAQRDYVDVRDAVRAYALIAEHGAPGQVYNVCSEQAFSMSEILQMLMAQSKVPIKAVLDPSRVQQQDVPVQIGSAKKIRQLTGWKPQINIKQSLADLLDNWREKIDQETTQ